ncbi:MAG TPA: VWA domain-containing protein [Candidatus Sulfopaludibacter sp.]|jgi:VWFA-related protein|nr:VWA domain-containing protein [Candidatus Sulfopaludibacter sp.]
MAVQRLILTAVAGLCLFLAPLQAEILLLRGKVVMQDGTVPHAVVTIERACAGSPPLKKATTDAKGQYFWHVQDGEIPTDLTQTGDSRFGQTGESNWMQGVGATAVPCRLQAKLSGYVSSSINLANLSWSLNPELPMITLYRQGTQEFTDIAAISVPSDALTAWGRAAKAMQSKNWPEAEKNLRAAVQAAPKFADGWNTLAAVCQNQKNVACEREATQHAITVAPKALDARMRLMRLEMEQKEWQAAATAAADLMKADAAHTHPEAYSSNAIIRFHLKDLEGALASATEAVRLDATHMYPDSERVLGMILEAKADYPAAGTHLKKYLELEPKAADATEVRTRIENLGKGPVGELTTVLDAADHNLTIAGEAWVPGGLKAMAAVAHLPSAPTYGNFFELYCKAIEHENSMFNGVPLPKYAETIQTFAATVVELTRLGEKRGTSTLVAISPANAAHLLPLLGWRLVQQEGDVLIEPGDRPADALRQSFPAAFGIDELALRDALVAHKTFSFEIPTENARLLGGAAWSKLLKDPNLPGGIAEAFARDFRLAKAYAGLSAMSPEAATAFVKGEGLRNLVLLYSGLLTQYGDAFAVSQGTVMVPGGKAAEAQWAELAGANPQDAPAFFHKVLEKDHGTLAAYYYALAHADAAHQLLFTQTPKRAQFFYTWYRESGEIYQGLDRKVGNWRGPFFQNVPLDADGHVHYPGGKAAWTASAASNDDALMEVKNLEALGPVAQMERDRKSPLDAAAAELLVQHYGEWSSLLPYLSRLPAVGAAELQVLPNFAERVSALKPAARNSVMAEWHSLVELIVLGSNSGALTPEQATRTFRLVCQELAGNDHGTKAVAILRALAGNAADLDSAVPSQLLRLSGARLAAYERVKELQGVPRLDAAHAPAALSGAVYAALLDPGNLMVAADPALLAKHRFIKDEDVKHPPVFYASELVSSTVAPGSYLAGGFGGMTETVKGMTRLSAETPATASSTEVATPTTADATGPAATEAVFRTTARLVEVYATVTDDRGRYVDDLPSKSFTILENGKPISPIAFESRASSVSLALLFDTTGSMHDALPSLKSAALKLIGELRPIDSVAVYSFADKVNELQPFTSDKTAAERAVLRTQAFGATALYDALVRVNHDLAARSGKKVIVVFTDGSDNLSVLTTEIAMQRAKSAGVPIYTIAQGDALKSPELLKQLGTLSKTTGGVAFRISGPGEIRKVFETVSQDLMHGYLLAFQPPSVEGHNWRTVEITLADTKNRKVRAREGYYPE